jgi:4-hydroxy-3-polyprenylbenzoate decarboxylase
MERMGGAGGGFEGGIGIDATVPFEFKGEFTRSHYPVDRIDLRRWFSEEQIATVTASQDEYAKVLARTGA